MDAEFGKTKQQTQSFLILPDVDEIEKNIWESLGRERFFLQLPKILKDIFGD